MEEIKTNNQPDVLRAGNISLGLLSFIMGFCSLAMPILFTVILFSGILPSPNSGLGGLAWIPFFYGISGIAFLVFWICSVVFAVKSIKKETGAPKAFALFSVAFAVVEIAVILYIFVIR